VLDSRHWKTPEPAATMPFQLDGDAVPTSRTSSRKTWISTAEGLLARASSQSAWIEGEETISLQHSLPSHFDLCALLGRRVRVTLMHVHAIDSGTTQTLTIAGHDGRPLVIAHSGEVRGIAHRLGGLQVYVALSQRPGGPMVFGTRRVQSLVRAGDHVRVRDEADVYVMHFQAREGAKATYAIAEESVWRGPPSTRR
jgi:hypothetical protein